MGRTYRIKLRFRRFGRRHPWISFTVRSFIVFSATFGVGSAFLFAIACVALATMSVRFRFLRKKMRMIALHNEAMADRNWELQEAEQRTRRLFQSPGDLLILRDTDGCSTFVHDAYCELAEAA